MPDLVLVNRFTTDDPDEVLNSLGGVVILSGHKILDAVADGSGLVDLTAETGALAPIPTPE